MREPDHGRPDFSQRQVLEAPKSSATTTCGTAVTSNSTNEKVDGAQVRVNNEECGASVAFRNLTVFGFGTSTDYQKTFANYPLAYLSRLRILFGRTRKVRIDILKDFEGLVARGEILLVLGRPGSGCTTFLKTLAGQTHGLHVDDGSDINYQGNVSKEIFLHCRILIVFL